MARGKSLVKIKSGKKRGSRNSAPMIRLNTRKVNKRKRSGKEKARLIAGLFVLGVFLVLAFSLFAGARLLAQKLYSRNSQFVIKHINIKGSLMLSPALVREYLQVDEGMNLFALDIENMRKDFIRRVPGVKSMSLSRKLPDTLEISITERLPLAKLGIRSPLVVDRYGMIFVFKGPSSQLPVIWGYSRKRSRPGVKIIGKAQAALEALSAIDDNPSLGLNVALVDVSRDDYLVLRLTDGKRIKLAWKDMGMQTDTSKQALLTKLGKVSSALHTRKGMKLAMLDATMDNNLSGSYSGK